jgi:hypothetical protein
MSRASTGCREWRYVVASSSASVAGVLMTSIIIGRTLCLRVEKSVRSIDAPQKRKLPDCEVRELRHGHEVRFAFKTV